MRLCDECGAPLAAGNQFCSTCGAAIHPVAGEPSPVEMRGVPLADAAKPPEGTPSVPMFASSTVAAPVSAQAHPSATPVANARNLAAVQPGAVRGIRLGHTRKVALSALAVTLAVAGGIAWWVQTGSDTSIGSANGSFGPGGVVLNWDGTRWANAYIVSQDGTEVAEVSQASWFGPRDQKTHLYTITAINRQSQARYVTGGTITLRCPAAPLPGGQSECEVQPPGVAVQPVATPISTPTPIETATSSPETSSASTPEKRSVESYQITVKDNPTVNKAAESFGMLHTEFTMGGKFDENTNDEKPDSVHADDNMLTAFFGTDAESRFPDWINEWRKTRVILSRARYMIPIVSNNYRDLDYEMKYIPKGADQPAPKDERQLVEVAMKMSSYSAAERAYFPNADVSHEVDLNMFLTVVKNKDGVMVWEFVRSEDANP